ncbi:hypothetical protein SAMD00019534_080090 [Acytostelium subglobosum LB1]|uniref:hypothetical protein n=1 Tax=Acytostelium subglobosum LB1 TaxID=1410327 RepID=UPI000644BA17|nr:hypothetical protein SAMD00019534_080090 [Acytostelium subglobosum LB1]GAM24834.1 hypothetical protein SAMD00019534_080090 [Acytostelium subglobosum LB1]|eukprot:XP_012752503.1 hypothetical protein SAMD00019534_080090 [Acytostelium subglobosum LB1]
MSRSTRDIGGRLKKTGVTEIKLTGNYTRADIERIAQQDSNTLQRYGANARIEVVLDYGNHQYRSGKFTKVGEPIIMFDPHEYDGAPIAEPDTFKSFYIYVHQAKGKAGGCNGEWNNCLYHCLLDAYPEQVTEHFGKPSRLKLFLDLDVKQKVSIKRIPELEARLNIRINVKGDHCYASASKATREVNLILTNTHYKLDKEGTYVGKGIRHTRHKDRDVYIKPIVFKYLKGEQVQLYDDGEYMTISLEQFINSKRRKYQDKCEYIRILSGKSNPKKLKNRQAMFVESVIKSVPNTTNYQVLIRYGENPTSKLTIHARMVDEPNGIGICIVRDQNMDRDINRIRVITGHLTANTTAATGVPVTVTTPYETILFNVNLEKRVGIIQFNRPTSMNSISDKLVDEFLDALNRLDNDGRVNSIIITGNDRAFCCGADIKELVHVGYESISKSGNMIDRITWMARTTKPIIAAVGGLALGGGCEIALLADIVVASEKARFGLPEIKIGTIPGAGGTQRLTKAVGKSKAMEMILTGRMMDAAEAKSYNLVSRVEKDQQAVMEAAMAIAADIGSMSLPIVTIAKKAINRSFETNLTEGMNAENDLFLSTFAYDDRKEGMDAFTKKRKPVWKNKY